MALPNLAELKTGAPLPQLKTLQPGGAADAPSREAALANLNLGDDAGASTAGSWFDALLAPSEVKTKPAPQLWTCKDPPNASWHGTEDKRDQMCEQANNLKRQMQTLDAEAEVLKNAGKDVEAQEKLVEARKVQLQYEEYINTDENRAA